MANIIIFFETLFFYIRAFIVNTTELVNNYLTNTLSWLRLRRYKEAAKLDTKLLDKSSDAIFSEFDMHLRSLEVVDKKPSADELKNDLLYSMEKLNKAFINSSNRVYEKIQNLEAIYSKTQSQLNNKLYYELRDLENEEKSLEKKIEKIDKKIEEYEDKKEKIEEQYNSVENRKVFGDLSRLPSYAFWIIMFLVGAAEFFIYQNVFLSQEIGLMADTAAEDKERYVWMSGVMSIGFILMIIWMSHALGRLSRHFVNTTAKERYFYIVKIFIILLVSFSAIWATVNIRGTMHTILAFDNKVKIIKEKVEKADEANAFGGDDDEAFGNEEDEAQDGEAFGAEDDEEEDDTFGEDEELKLASLESDPQELEKEADSYREKVYSLKEETASVFMLINLFIFIGGAFLSYFSHTSSPIYEMIEDEISKLKTQRKYLLAKLRRLKKMIVWMKKYTIDTLFKRLLQEAALYDLQVRTYNGYIDALIIKLNLLEGYLRSKYKGFGVDVEELSVTELAKEFIDIDDRKELHHVEHIEEYMIYQKRVKKGEGEDA